VADIKRLGAAEGERRGAPGGIMGHPCGDGNSYG
jgi:hypothetical protein